MLTLLVRANRLTLIALSLVLVLMIYLWNSKLGDPFLPFSEKDISAQPLHIMNEGEKKSIESLFVLLEPQLPVNVPDLRSEIVYLGKNERPDAEDKEPSVFLSIGGSETLPVTCNKPLFLEKRLSSQRFGPAKEATPLWIEIAPQFNGAELAVRTVMKAFDDEKSLLFTLREQQQMGNQPPEIGKLRMDSSLFARQRARWVGEDLFMNEHGGPEYAHLANKQRIEFGEGDAIYSCYVLEGDCIIWDQERWKEETPSSQTRSFFLAQLKKVEERLMHFTLWSPDGRSRISLSLVKPVEPPTNTKIVEDFKYIGAKSKKQWIFELRGKRITLKQNDWWLCNEKGWTKLSTPEQIDQYVDKRLIGILFIFEGIIKRQGSLYLKGHIYNATRTQEISLMQPLQGQPPLVSKTDRPMIPPPPQIPTPRPDNSDESSPLPPEQVEQIADSLKGVKSTEINERSKLRSNPRGAVKKG